MVVLSTTEQYPMRTTKTLSISLPPAQLRQAERLARSENRTMSELVREALRRYEEHTAVSQAAREALALALQASRRDAARRGTDRLPLSRINAEIAAVRGSRPRKPSAVSANRGNLETPRAPAGARYRGSKLGHSPTNGRASQTRGGPAT